MSRTLRAGLLGLANAGDAFLDAVRGESRIDLAALADTDNRVVDDRAAALGIVAFHDYRQAIVESPTQGIGALFVALPPVELTTYLPLAGGRLRTLGGGDTLTGP